MAHIQHELLEHQKCDTLQFHYVACYLVAIASVLYLYKLVLKLQKNYSHTVTPHTVVLTKLYRMN